MSSQRDAGKFLVENVAAELSRVVPAGFDDAAAVIDKFHELGKPDALTTRIEEFKLLCAWAGWNPFGTSGPRDARKYVVALRLQLLAHLVASLSMQVCPMQEGPVISRTQYLPPLVQQVFQEMLVAFDLTNAEGYSKIPTVFSDILAHWKAIMFFQGWFLSRRMAATTWWMRPAPVDGTCPSHGTF